MDGLWEFASYGGSTLSRGWLATVKALGYSQAPTFNLSETVGYIFGRMTFKCLKLFYYSKSLPEW